MNFNVTRLENAVEAMMVILDPDDIELNDTDCRNIVRNAIGAVIKKQGGGKAVSASAVLNEADTLAADFFRIPSLEYTLVTSLSIPSLPIKSIKVHGCEIIRVARDKYPLPNFPMLKTRDFCSERVYLRWRESKRPIGARSCQ